MQLRYDIYVEFEEPRENAGDVAREVSRQINDGIMGISGSSLYEDGYVLTSMFFIDPSLVFEDVSARFGSELPDDIVERLENEFTGYVDVVVQRVSEDNYDS